MWRRHWLVFSQAVTVALAVLFVVDTLKPDWLAATLNVRRAAPLPAPTYVPPVAALPAPSPAATSSSAAPAVAPSGGLALAARRAAPAVVSVLASKAGRTTNPHADDPRFRFFFDGMPDRAPVPAGLGSGVIVSTEGYLLTNNHVVEGATEIEVKLADGRQARARLVGTDPETDLAVLKIDLDRLPVIALGRLADLQVGDAVLAIGNPFNVGQTVTAGIVSALGRNLPDDSYVPFIQTDVAINPGNSGGPLFNLDGEVIGINSQIYSRSGGYEGISFAIPIDVAMKVSRQLQANGRVTRGRLGVNIQDVDQALAESFGLDAPKGALVANVEQGSPAAKAGVQPGDVILQYGGRAIESAGQLPSVVAATSPGTEVELVVWRDRAKRELEVKVGESKPDAQLADAGAREDAGKLGLMVRPLSPEERGQVEVPSGLLVEDVDGAAAEAGIRPGDIVLSANGAPTATVADLKRVVSGSKDHVALLVQRGDARIFVPVELG